MDGQYSESQVFHFVTCIEELQNVEMTLYRSMKNVSDSADGTLTLYPFSKSSLENSESTAVIWGGELDIQEIKSHQWAGDTQRSNIMGIA